MVFKGSCVAMELLHSAQIDFGISNARLNFSNIEKLTRRVFRNSRFFLKNKPCAFVVSLASVRSQQKLKRCSVLFRIFPTEQTNATTENINIHGYTHNQ